MPENDLKLLTDAALRAGEIATSFVGSQAARWDKPGNLGPVTEADLAVNKMLEETLQPARPSYGWLSEETDDSTDRLNCETVFIVDPIDGTRSFVEGSNTWAHSLAIAKNGIVTTAVVYLPQRNRLFAASLGQGANLNGEPIAASNQSDLEQSVLLAAKPAMAAEYWQNGTAPSFKRGYRPSLAYRLALVGQGRFDGMITLRKTWEWDIAAGALIISEAGGKISNKRGGPLRFNNADPRLDGVVATAPAIHKTLIDALA